MRVEIRVWEEALLPLAKWGSEILPVILKKIIVEIYEYFSRILGQLKPTLSTPVIPWLCVVYIL